MQFESHIRNVFGAAAAALTLLAGPALSQAVDVVPRHFIDERLRQDGNAITFCYNSAGMMAEFEQDLAREIGGILLAEVKFDTIKSGDWDAVPLNFDYRIPLSTEQMFVMMTNRCDAFMGVTLSSRNPEWMSITRPYLTAESVIITKNPDANRMQDIPYGEAIGVRISAPGDTQLINYLSARPAGQSWRRAPSHDNKLVLEKLDAGTISAALIWEIGLMGATDGDPEAHGYHIMTPRPFPMRNVQFGIATRQDNSYLNTMLSEAIAAVEAAGTVDALLIEHKLKRAE